MSCDPRRNFEIFYFILILHLISGKVTKLLLEKLSTSEVLRQNLTGGRGGGGGEGEHPSVSYVVVHRKNTSVVANPLFQFSEIIDAVLTYLTTEFINPFCHEQPSTSSSGLLNSEQFHVFTRWGSVSYGGP